jgi:hypothetical protein
MKAQIGEITKLELYAITGKRIGRSAEEVEAAVWLLLRSPKGSDPKTVVPWL